mmetsp:Transcript_59829/g.68044  ORF Transcript_59829/g.68044 Transcript_59829/m.68044 type:complete len:352 (-) Transcript_59829:192-1247(-)
MSQRSDLTNEIPLKMVHSRALEMVTEISSGLSTHTQEELKGYPELKAEREYACTAAIFRLQPHQKDHELVAATRPMQLADPLHAKPEEVVTHFRNEPWIPDAQLQLLYLIRSEREKDRHSGQIGFPGGHHDNEDQSLYDTVCRETREEIGIDLKDNSKYVCLGQNPDRYLYPSWRKTHLFLANFVFLQVDYHQVNLELEPDEVQEFRWVPFYETFLHPNLKLQENIWRGNMGKYAKNVEWWSPCLFVHQAPAEYSYINEDPTTTIYKLWGITYEQTMMCIQRCQPLFPEQMKLIHRQEVKVYQKNKQKLKSRVAHWMFLKQTEMGPLTEASFFQLITRRSPKHINRVRASL